VKRDIRLYVEDILESIARIEESLITHINWSIKECQIQRRRFLLPIIHEKGFMCNHRLLTDE
jgi:uncharacterized protein with HEPN domain